MEFLLWATSAEQMKRSAQRGNPPTRKSLFHGSRAGGEVSHPIRRNCVHSKPHDHVRARRTGTKSRMRSVSFFRRQTAASCLLRKHESGECRNREDSSARHSNARVGGCLLSFIAPAIAVLLALSIYPLIYSTHDQPATGNVGRRRAGDSETFSDSLRTISFSRRWPILLSTLPPH